MKLSVVIPAYNESENIRTTIRNLLSLLDKQADIERIEIIIVDDHSLDNTYDIVHKMHDSRIRCLRLSRRSGSHIVLRAGIAEASGDVVLCISADGQDDPIILREMLKKWREGNYIVWALRKSRREPIIMKLFAIVFYRILLCLNKSNASQIDLSRADFYLLDRKVVDAINSCEERNTSLFGLIVWLGFKQNFVEYERRLRLSGRSKWTLRSKFNLAKDWIIAFSGIPLKIISAFGFFISLSGFLYAIYVVFNAYLGNPITGWSSLIVAVLFLGGVQMIMLGFIGEYLWRNLEESRKRPLYFIEKKTKN